MNKKLFFLIINFIGVVTLSGCATTAEGGLERYNRSMYSINRAIDKVTLKPLAKGYKAITPEPVEKSINNFFNNLGEVNTFVNSLLQGKFHNAAASSARLVWNTTLGIGGLFDVASAMNIEADQEDLGQTLRHWGVPAGPYVVLPILGPSTPTDAVGLVGDYFISPLSYEELWHNDDVQLGLVVLDKVNDRAQLIKTEALVTSATTDEYSFVKSAYLQRRKALTNDGKVAETNEVDEAFDELFGE